MSCHELLTSKISTTYNDDEQIFYDLSRPLLRDKRIHNDTFRVFPVYLKGTLTIPVTRGNRGYGVSLNSLFLISLLRSSTVS